ncbi:MAG: ribosome small subunit-dependent GTPase A [Planctomycetota bacterium]
MTEELLIGTVVRMDARVVHVAVGTETLPCAIRGRLFEESSCETRPIAVGDRVHLVRDGAQGVIVEREPRKTRLVRGATAPDKTQVIAANVDLAVIVTSTRDPPLRLGLLDRMLVACEREGIPPLIVVNKIDLPPPDPIEEELRAYAPLGYPILFTSAVTGVGVEALAERLREHLSVFVGHSGVGKSSLLNAIQPGLELTIGELNLKRRTGRHTTTQVALLRLDRGGFVVDTPGFRTFALAGMPPADLSLYFPEIEAVKDTCRYANCLHEEEPDCAVKLEVAAGSIAESRYDSYCRILENLRGGGERAPRHDSYEGT